MPSDLHEHLARLGVKWLMRQGFSVVTTDLSAAGVSERADVIGFRSTCSTIIESKISRSDFLKDNKKPHRVSGGLGLYRFYICPSDLIVPEELPEKWGLLYVNDQTVIEIVRPKGNIWPAYGTTNTNWLQFQHDTNLEAERNILFSISRRLVQGKSILK